MDTLDGRGTLNGPRENRRQGLLALEVRIELDEGLGLHKAILVEKSPRCRDSEESQHDLHDHRERLQYDDDVIILLLCIASAF